MLYIKISHYIMFEIKEEVSMKKYIIRLNLLVLLLSFSGCIYPVYRTLYPQLNIEIKDVNNKPIKSATVHLGRITYFEPESFNEKLFTTNSEGKIEADSSRAWGTDILIIHGATVYQWSLCIEKKGFQTFTTPWAEKDDFEKSKKIFILKKGVKTLCREDKMENN